jgi:hypothetical protein
MRPGRAMVAVAVCAVVTASLYKFGVFTNDQITTNTPRKDGIGDTRSGGIVSRGSPNNPTSARSEILKPKEPYTLNGHPVDLEGLPVKQFVEKYSPAARLGDAQAAWKVYLGEGLCSDIPNLKDLAAETHQEQVFAGEIAAKTEACRDVTPAMMDERMYFVTQAARAGIDDARIAFANEGPGGHLKGVDLLSPAVKPWSDQAIDFLKQSASDGNRVAMVYLASAYSDGRVTQRDPQQALVYAAANAALVSKDRPDIQITDNPLVKELSRELTPDQVTAAIAQGQQLASNGH